MQRKMKLSESTFIFDDICSYYRNMFMFFLDIIDLYIILYSIFIKEYFN